MPPLEPLEDRRQFGIDTTFASGGLSVKGGQLRQLLPTTAGLFVEKVPAKMPTASATVAKYTEAGLLETTWGDGGRITVGPPVDGAISLAYDPRSDALYVASPTAAGDTGGHLLDIQRYRSDGTLDTTFGNRGTFLAVPPAVNRRKYDLARMTPLAGGKLLIAFTQTDRVTPAATIQEQSDLNLLRLTRAGRRDTTFGGGVVTLATGTKVFNSTGVLVARGDTQTLADLRTRADGSIRVLTLRDRTVENITPGLDDETISLEDFKRLTSVVVSPDGSVHRALTRSWTVARSSDTISGGEDFATLFNTESTHLDPDGNVTVIGRRGHAESTVVLNLLNTGVRAAPRALALPAGSVADAVVYAADDTAFVTTAGAIVKFDSGLTPVPGWGTNGVLPMLEPPDLVQAADDQGRLFVLDADRVHVRRLIGG